MFSEGVRELQGGVFGEVTFEEVFIQYTSISNINSAVLLPLKDRLQYMKIGDGVLEVFPWEVVPQLTNLHNLDLWGNALTSLPPLQSTSLEFLDISANEIAQLEVGWSLPNLRYLRLGECEHMACNDSKMIGLVHIFDS